MVRTRIQLEHLSKDELIDELLSIENISSKLANLNTWFDDSILNNAQYHRRKSIEVSSVPASISDKELEDNICNVLSLTSHEVIPDDLQACYRLKKGGCDCKIQIQETETKNPHWQEKFLQ